MRPHTAALLLASLAGAAADAADDDREKPPPLAQVMSIPDLTEVCGPCNECMGPEAAKTDPDDAAIIGIKVTSCLKKCAPCVKDFLNVYCTMSPTRVMITQPCCYDLSASVSKRLEEGTASVVKLITKRKDFPVPETCDNPHDRPVIDRALGADKDERRPAALAKGPLLRAPWLWWLVTVGVTAAGAFVGTLAARQGGAAAAGGKQGSYAKLGVPTSNGSPGSSPGGSPLLKRGDNGVAGGSPLVPRASSAKAASPDFSPVKLLRDGAVSLCDVSDGGRFGALDGVRAICMLWVLALHAASLLCEQFETDELDGNIGAPTPVFQAQWALWRSAPFKWILMQGDLAVDGFLVLSGFLMCHIGAAELRKQGVLRFPMFMLRRFLRLWPLLFAVSVITAAYHQQDWLATHWRTLAYVRNFFCGLRPDFLNHTWTLSLEFQLYAISVPVVRAMESVERPVLVPAAMTLAVVAIKTWVHVQVEAAGVEEGLFFSVATGGTQLCDDFYPMYLYTSSALRSPAFYIGMCVWACVDKQSAADKRSGAAVGVGAAARTAHAVAGTALVVATVWYGEASRDWFTRDPVLNALALSPGRAIFSAAVGYVIWGAVLHRSALDGFLQARVWKLPARLSYGMYLLHIMVYGWLKPVDAWVEASAPYGVGVTYCWLLAVRIVAVGAVAAVLHVLVEYPFMQFASSLKAPPKKPAAANGAV
jgi:peptidoglycan/LPS O-acetylase OafA/YrhL